jgi:hypothetical protein
MKLLVKIALPALAQLGNNMSQEFTFTITKEEANVILVALQELPGKICNPLSEKLRKQALSQLEGRVIHHSIEEGIAVEERMSGG